MFKHYIARPNKEGIVEIPHDFIPAGDMDPETGIWEGYVLSK